MKNFAKTLRVLVMPKLSPTMTHGMVHNFTLKVGQAVNSYDKVMDVSTKSLLNTSDELALMEIEVMEDMFAAKIMASSGDQLPVGAPLAILCDNEGDIKKAQDYMVSVCFHTICNHT